MYVPPLYDHAQAHLGICLQFYSINAAVLLQKARLKTISSGEVKTYVTEFVI